MNKPVKKYCHQPAYDYNEVIDYIEDKYNIKTRDHYRTSRDFWHKVTERYDWIRRDGYFRLEVSEWIKEIEEGAEIDWIKEILQMIYDEFHEDEMQMYTDW